MNPGIAERYEKIKENKLLQTILLWGSVIACTIVMLTLCNDNKAMDYDEAYSYFTTKGNTLIGICRDIIDAYDTDIPLWYMMLRAWTMVFGEGWLAYKLFAVSGNVATLILGATAVRRHWGARAAFLFIWAIGLVPAMLDVGINVRMYSWTAFLILACALVVYRLIAAPERKSLWVWLTVITFCALGSHYFTAFYFLFLYVYLLAELFAAGQKKYLWKPFVCGGVCLVPFGIWMVISGFFHLKASESTVGTSKLDFYDAFRYLFETLTVRSTEMGILFFLLILAGYICFRKRFVKRDWRFLFLCFVLFMVVYWFGAMLASLASHFYTPRHVMHGIPLMWLGIAVLLSKVNWPAYLSGLLFVVTMGMSNYEYCWLVEYANAPYLDETYAFIEENVQPGDVILYNAEEKFDLLYRCYMPEQEYIYFENLEDIQELAGRRIWFLDSRDPFFTEEQIREYRITYENLGHYGFQKIDDCGDFDILRMEIGGKAQ